MTIGGVARAACPELFRSYAKARPQAELLWGRASGVLGGAAGHDLRLFQPVPMYIAKGLGSRKWDIDGTEYTQNGGSSWMGFFLNHRPFEDSQWFRINTGIGIGGIEGTLTNDAGDEYAVEYNENPVGYIGVGFGNGTAEGFTFGFDIGGLFGSGPEITVVEGDGADLEDIQDNAFFGNILPNLQLTVGYNF